MKTGVWVWLCLIRNARCTGSLNPEVRKWGKKAFPGVKTQASREYEGLLGEVLGSDTPPTLLTAQLSGGHSKILL